PALLAQYPDMKRWVRTPAIDDMATIAPPAAVMARLACLIVRNVPVRLTSSVYRHSSSDIPTMGPAAPPPALATAMSSRPAVAAVCTAASTADSSVTSQAIVRTVAPETMSGSSAATA